MTIDLTGLRLASKDNGVPMGPNGHECENGQN